MKKNGFTLIELLAVIVILAIIVLIAAPVVVDIIGDSKKDGILRGTSLYLKAVNMAIADAQMDTGLMPEGTFEIDENGNVCFNEDCTDKLIVKTTGTIPSSGTITIEGTSITAVDFDYDGATVVINERGVPEFYESVCTLVSGKAKEVGSKYSCEVKEGTKYNFYVLGIDGNGVATMIMDKNIVENIHWLTKDDYESLGGSTLVGDGMGCDNGPSVCSNYAYGPITAMDALHNATKDWENVLPAKINYTNTLAAPYSIGTESTVTSVKNPGGEVIKTYTGLKAKMLSKEEFDSYKSSVSVISEGNEYWTLSSQDYSAYTSLQKYKYITHANCVEGNYSPGTVESCQPVGIRPVIQIEL